MKLVQGGLLLFLVPSVVPASADDFEVILGYPLFALHIDVVAGALLMTTDSSYEVRLDHLCQPRQLQRRNSPLLVPCEFESHLLQSGKSGILHLQNL